jgi:hypothetical protein
MKVAVLALGGVALALAGCSGGSASSYVPTTQAAAAKSDMPPGFQELEFGVGFRWADNFGTEYECASYAESCFGVELYSVYGCPSGVYIELALLNETGAVVGRANEITAGLAPGDHAVVGVVSTTEAPKAKVSQINCMG